MPHRDPRQATGHSASARQPGLRLGAIASTGLLLILLALALASPKAMAQTLTQNAPLQSAGSPACPASFATQPPATTNARLASQQKMQELAAACDKRADYHAYKGSLLLVLGQNLQAANALEKALLINPDLPGAQLDYAQALALLGEKESAQQLVTQVTARPDIDPGLRQWLLNGMQASAHVATGWSWAQLLQTTVGHETNLASATHANAITLYLSNGPVLVPLDEGARPQHGGALKTLLALQGTKAMGQADLRLGMALQSRHTLTSSVADSHMAEISGAYIRQAGPGNAQLRWEGHHYRQNDNFAYQDQGLTLKYEITPMPCKWSASLGTIAQQYPGSLNLNGQYTHGRLEGACKHSDQSETQWGVGAGQDKAQNALRPGGDKKRGDWTIRHERPASHSTSYGWVRQTRIQDSEQFSSLLGDLVSKTTRIDWGLGIWWPLGVHWSAGLDVESTSQKSSNALLNIKNLSIYSGLRWTGK